MAPLTFFFDRNIGKRVPKALRTLCPPVLVRYHQEVGFDRDADDDAWLPVVGEKGWVVISQDRKFHEQATERAAIKTYSIRCFYLPCASQTRWHTLCNFVRSHERMIALAEREPAPFIFELKGDGYAAWICRHPQATA